MPWYKITLFATYFVVLGILSFYGFHRSALVWLYYRNKNKISKPKRYFTDHLLPKITIQCPLYNEIYVAERLIEAVAKINYPRDRFEIQVLDDSTDETQTIARSKVEELKKTGLDISYIHRTDRSGFKAGALEEGVKVAKGEFIMVFDADFMPKPDMLKKMVHYFTDDNVGMVQARWGHVNRNYSTLTEIEAIMLDGHFVIEHTARHRSGRFFNFNGTAGIWRKDTIIDAGGWHHDTLTEDLDLSFRAQLKGWDFIYLPDIVSPAELPVEMNSFKSQQFRWAKGSIQVAKKLLPTILKADVGKRIKLEAFVHLTANFAYPLLFLLSILLLPNLLLRTEHGWREVVLIDLPLMFGTTLSVCSFYIASQRNLDLKRPPSGWLRFALRLPLTLSLGIGLCINQTRAVLEAVFGRDTAFIRTPKHGLETRDQSWSLKRYRATKNLVPYIELMMAIYLTCGVVIAFRNQHFFALPFLLLFTAGFGYIGTMSVCQRN